MKFDVLLPQGMTSAWSTGIWQDAQHLNIFGPSFWFVGKKWVVINIQSSMWYDVKEPDLGRCQRILRILVCVCLELSQQKYIFLNLLVEGFILNSHHCPAGILRPLQHCPLPQTFIYCLLWVMPCVELFLWLSHFILFLKSNKGPCVLIYFYKIMIKYTLWIIYHKCYWVHLQLCVAITPI